MRKSRFELLGEHKGIAERVHRKVASMTDEEVRLALVELCGGAQVLDRLLHDDPKTFSPLLSPSDRLPTRDGPRGASSHNPPWGIVELAAAGRRPNVSIATITIEGRRTVFLRGKGAVLVRSEPFRGGSRLIIDGRPFALEPTGDVSVLKIAGLDPTTLTAAIENLTLDPVKYPIIWE